MTTTGQKVALITGGAKRIGRAIAITLSQQGWDVAVHDRPSAAVAFDCGQLSCIVNCTSLYDDNGAAVLLAQALYDLTPEGGQAVMVNVFDSHADSLASTLSQAALHSATRVLAQALAPKVRVAEVVTGLASDSMLDDIAAVVSFIVSSPAITGASLLVDGGRHLIP